MLGVINHSPIKLFDNLKNSAKTIENKKVMGDASCGLHYNSSLKRMWVHLTFNQVVAGSIPARPTKKLLKYQCLIQPQSTGTPTQAETTILAEILFCKLGSLREDQRVVWSPASLPPGGGYTAIPAFLVAPFTSQSGLSSRSNFLV